MEAIFSHHPKI